MFHSMNTLCMIADHRAVINANLKEGPMKVTMLHKAGNLVLVPEPQMRDMPPLKRDLSKVVVIHNQANLTVQALQGSHILVTKRLCSQL